MNKVRIFISYANEDRPFLDQLLKHLASLVSEGLIEPWTDRGLQAGDRWDDEIRAELECAKVILLLVSADFLASTYIASVELRQALEREQRREAVVVPVILRYADWQHAPFHYLQALPDKGKPVSDWRNRDEAYLNVATGLRNVIAHMQGGTASSAASKPVTPADPETVQQNRILDAAMAAKIPLGKPSDLTVLVRKTDSEGLRAVLREDDEFSATPEDVKSKPFQMEFRRDANGGLRPERLTVQIESPDFDPPAQLDQIVVPPDRDSDVCTFLLRPLYPGELVVKLKVFAEDGANAVRLMRIFSEASDRAIEGGRVVVSIPIATVAGRQHAAAAPEAGQYAAASAASAGPARQTLAFPPPPAPTRRAPTPLQEVDPQAVDSMQSYGRSTIPPREKKNRRWVLPAASAAAATVLIGTAIVQLAPMGADRNPHTEVFSAFNLPVDPPRAPSIASGAGSRAPASAAPPPSAASGDAGGSWTGDYQDGLSLAKSGDYPAAAQRLAQAVRQAPAQAAPLNALAAANLHLADSASGAARKQYLDSAIGGANRLVELQPDSASARYLQGLALEKDGQYAAAEAPLRSATSLDPDNANAWYALGLALQKQGKDKDAIPALQKALLLDSKNTDARLLLASLLREQDPAAARRNIVILKNDASLSSAKREAVGKLQTSVANDR